MTSKPDLKNRARPPPSFPPSVASLPRRREEGSMLDMLAGVALAFASGGGGAPAPAASFHVATHQAALNYAALRALDGASQRLARHECAAIFSDFADANGHRLQDNLDALGKSGPEYLGLIVFYDGQGRDRCNQGTSLAVTTVGSRVVWLCPAFAFEQGRDPGWAEATLIHEALHSLGLGENPPSSTEISLRVVQRCGR